MWLLGFSDDIDTTIIAVVAILLIAYSVGLYRPLTVAQEAYQEIQPRQLLKVKKIIGLDWAGQDALVVELQRGGKFVVFEYCISPLVVTLRYTSNVHFIEAGEVGWIKGIRYSIISLLFGWASIFGIVHTIQCLYVNFRGGRDITEQVAFWLQGYGYYES